MTLSSDTDVMVETQFEKRATGWSRNLGKERPEGTGAIYKDEKNARHQTANGQRNEFKTHSFYNH